MTKPFHYSKKNALAYQNLAIDSTSYEAPYREAEWILGDLKGKRYLDFGCGTGRSSAFLLQLNAMEVIAADHNENMIRQAVSLHAGQSITFHLIKDSLPVAPASLDGAFSSYVFMEMNSLSDIEHFMQEIGKGLKPGAPFVILVTNPDSAFGHDYVSFKYKDAKELKSGDQTPVTIKGPDPFTITDYYWTESDYRLALQTAGFDIKTVTFPKPARGEWLDEMFVPPSMVISAKKK